MIYYICLPKNTEGKSVYFTQSNNTRIYKENIITLISRQLTFMVCCGPIMPFFVTTQTSTYIYGGFVLCLFGGFDCFKIFLDHIIPISSLLVLLSELDSSPLPSVTKDVVPSSRISLNLLLNPMFCGKAILFYCCTLVLKLGMYTASPSLKCFFTLYIFNAFSNIHSSM